MYTAGHLLALYITSAHEQDRAQVPQLAQDMQETMSSAVEVAFVDQGCIGEESVSATAGQDIDLLVVKLPTARKGFVLLPRRWVGERSFWLDDPFPPPDA